MKKVAGGLRLDLASFRELEAFAQLGTDLDAATQAQLDRGYRMVELLKQSQYKPMHVVDQILSIYAGTRGHLDDVPVEQVALWETEFLQFIHEQKDEIWKKIEQSGQVDDETSEAIDNSIAEFKRQYEGRRREEEKETATATS